MTDKEYIIFCDESVGKGRYYSNFYGGLLVGSSQYQRLTDQFNALKAELNLHGEVKWSRVSEAYLGKYQALVAALFDELRSGNLKLRIMFRQNAQVALGLTDEQIEGSYFRLYYQFIKHTFGLQHRDPGDGPASLRLYFDDFPATREAVLQFKGYIHALGRSPEFEKASIFLKLEDITEVRSHDHVLMQLLDIVLGAMAFRLNDLHLEKPPGSRTRGKKTRAKEKLYKAIRQEIHTLYPRLNIGTSTSWQGDPANRWHHPYRHWLFTPSEFEFRPEMTKKSGPTQPT